MAESASAILARPLSALLCAGTLLGACNQPTTSVVIENAYPPSVSEPLVVYRAFWQAVAFDTPIAPGVSSAPEPTVAASDNTAYAVLAPGWDPTSATPPTTFIVLASRSGFAVNTGDTLTIPVDDATFAGNCAAGSFLPQKETDELVQYVFTRVFAGLHYDAATCTTVAASDGGVP